MINVLLIDNYDSFVFNVKQLLDDSCLAKTTIIKNDQISIAEVAAYDRIILSPGPGIPSEAGIINEIIKEYKETKPILGICLGFQAIGEVFGAKLVPMTEILHGHASKINISSSVDSLFESIENPFFAGRYHSWILERSSLPECLNITAESEDGIVMAISHREYDLKGVLFHPESIMTPSGKNMIINWLNHNPK